MKRFKITLVSIVIGANLSIFLLNVKIEAAIMSIITVGTIYWALYKEDKK